MIRYELVNAETEVPMCGIVAGDEAAVIAVHDLEYGVGVVCLDDDADHAATVGVDPMYRGGLLLVSYDMEGREIHRAPVPETGVRPPALIMVGDEDATSGE